MIRKSHRRNATEKNQEKVTEKRYIQLIVIIAIFHHGRDGTFDMYSPARLGHLCHDYKYYSNEVNVDVKTFNFW